MGDWPLRDVQRQEAAGAVGATSTGTAIASSATTNTKGSWVELIASTAFDSSWVMVNWAGFDNVAGPDFLFDIGVGASGSEQVIVANLIAGQRGTWVPGGYLFPLAIPAGSRVAMRAQVNSGSARTGRVAIQIFGGGWNQDPGNRVVTYGAATADSGGVNVDPGGTVNTEGAWSEITSATTHDHFWLSLGIGNQLNTGRSLCDWLIDIAAGASGSEQLLIADLVMTGVAASLMVPQVFSLPMSVPAGTRLSVRAQCSINDATDRTFDAVVYGVS